jgi:hypothetical protein
MKIKLSVKFAFITALLGMALVCSCTAQNSDTSNNDSINPGTLPSDIAPNSPLAQVVQLAQAGVDESVILSYVNSSSSPFNLTSEQIIYLKDLGLPDDAVTAMIQRDQQLGAAVNATPAETSESTAQTETPAQPAEVTENYFYDTLSPYGGWVDIEGYGLCWRPTVVVYDSSWQPYCDHGHWVYTDAGWYWVSDYSWGATTFHYGRWFHNPRFGWCWWPDTTWAPSWVTWRYANDYCGWAPLPPHTVYHPGVGIYFNGALVSAGFDFGIRANFFTFVPTRNFNDPHPSRFRAPPEQVAKIYDHTTIINNFNVNNHDSHNQVIINNGIPPERITAVTHRKIARVNIQESPSSVPSGESLKRNTLFIHRPNISQNNVSALNRGIKPPVVHQNAPQQNNFSPAIHSVQPANHVSPGQQNILSAPVQHPVESATRVIPPNEPIHRESTPNYNSENRTIPPKQEPQLEDKSSLHDNTHQNAPAEHPVVNEPRSEPHMNNSSPAPKNSGSSPPSSQKSDKDQTESGH